jgi:hypothetical protein
MHQQGQSREDLKDVQQLQHRFGYLLGGDRAAPILLWHHEERQVRALLLQSDDLHLLLQQVLQSADLR